MNYQQVIRDLVIEGHMDYESVLDLTPYQIAALTSEKSDVPGEFSVEDYKRLNNGRS